MLKLNKLFTDCGGLGFILVMGHCGRSLLAKGNIRTAWVALTIVFLYTVFFYIARRRA